MAAACSTLYPDGSGKLDPTEVPKPEAAAPPAIPQGAPRTTGIETAASAEHQRLILAFGGAYRAAAAEAHLNGILARLAAVSDDPSQVYRVTILNSPVVNAFALPSGNLYVTRGMLALANDSSEIAAVMAHEIAHVSARHAFQREEQARIAELRTKVASAVQSPVRSEEIKMTGRLNLASFSRQQELEADRIGVGVIARAGFDPYGASRFLRSLGRSMAMSAAVLGGRSGDERPDILASHPSTPERVNRAVMAARQIAGPGVGDAGREAYLNAINGIDFGDDPGEGAVRGTRFIHGKLGFAFSAPEGFALENSPQAMLGIAEGGSKALRLDSVQIPSSTELSEYLGSGWVEGLEKESVRPATINGLPAAIGAASNSGWKFRVGVVRLNADVYRIIFAARALDAESDRTFMESINSFRRMSPDDARRLRPLRLALAAAGANDNQESMARRMAVPARARDVFALINGLQKNDRLQAGARYKLVVE
ncbi:MAG: Zn-dependent protease [Alphaproteobacteria bacterium]|nr:Zn-dependent protease [Alphaproteobacteria bacterium]